MLTVMCYFCGYSEEDSQVNGEYGIEDGSAGAGDGKGKTEKDSDLDASLL
jgi:hypothetical protein